MIIGLHQAIKFNKKQTLQFYDESIITPYLAPEIILQNKLYEEVDFYSLGIIMFELITGKVR